MMNCFTNFCSYLKSFPNFWKMRSNFLITDYNLHLLNAGVGVDIVKVRHLINLIRVRVPHLAPPGQLPVDQAQAVHVRPLPAVEHALVDAAVKKFWRHVALGTDLVVEGDVYLAVIKLSKQGIARIVSQE